MNEATLSNLLRISGLKTIENKMKLTKVNEA